MITINNNLKRPNHIPRLMTFEQLFTLQEMRADCVINPYYTKSIRTSFFFVAYFRG